MAVRREPTGHRPGRRSRPIAQVIAVCIVGICVAFPFYWMVVSSLGSGSAFVWPPQIIPHPLSLGAYHRIVTERPLGRWFLNTTLVAVATALFSLLVALNAGLSLSRFRTRLNGALGGVILITQMLPATLLVVPMYVIFKNAHLLDSLWGLVIADCAFSLPLSIWMLKGFFDSIPPEIEEAAMVDGCSHVGAYYRTTIPLALPGIIAVSIFSFMVAWGEFFFARTLINSESNWVLSVGLSSFQGEYTLAWSDMLAAATLFTIPPLLFFVGLQRYLISGLTGGAVKG